MPDRSIDRLTLYGERRSGNCMKTVWVARHVGLDFDFVEMDLVAGATRTHAYRAVNPFAKVPMARWPNGNVLTESNAIMLYLCELAADRSLLPAAAFDHARMMAWLFWEQYSHEPHIAGRRFQKVWLGKDDDELDPQQYERGLAALNRMEDHLDRQSWFAGDQLSLADVALVAYTRWAPEGGFDLGPYPQISAWISRVESAIDLS
ncbi:glutathione S-transferase family protein [Parvularcula sp. LCG005]|uniref:glutathione S-transferase family protein n=1 Tax=Parvularcula sp. LCG005 TaxID=3078805 RepID=UPI002942CC4C|nr:glutathione S-transferase family protein [Parvularcula sp. LCG005]WOI54438.1 glutathione S-transferase family protein [Parvularcula sp. LCG005]